MDDEDVFMNEYNNCVVSDAREKEFLSPNKPAFECPTKRPRNTDFGNFLKIRKASEVSDLVDESVRDYKHQKVVFTAMEKISESLKNSG